MLSMQSYQHIIQTKWLSICWILSNLCFGLVQKTLSRLNKMFCYCRLTTKLFSTIQPLFLFAKTIVCYQSSYKGCQLYSRNHITNPDSKYSLNNSTNAPAPIVMMIRTENLFCWPQKVWVEWHDYFILCHHRGGEVLWQCKG